MAEPTPATATFSGEQAGVIGRLSTTLTILGPLLVLVGLARLVYAVAVIWNVSWGGLWILPEGALLAFAGLAFIAGATDAGWLRDVKGREKEHFTNTVASINAGFSALLILGCYVAVVAFFRMCF